MKFIDEVKIEVKAGKGGAGSRSFRREAFEPMGGPDGGDGGRGGSVILVADRNKHTLLDFQFQPLWRAKDGGNGAGAQKTGRSGEDLEIHLPVGTQIYNAETDELVVDLDTDGQTYILAKGGRGGKGNEFFKTATHQAPDYAQPGEEGVSGSFRLSLKLVADVGLLGFPNAGKSTLISRISSARPKIADYPFTTLTPNLGVVRGRGTFSFVVADIPGLIPGASEGKGLGIKFLKHVERTRVLAHLIDLAAFDDEGNVKDPLVSYEEINRELQEYSPELYERPQLVVLTKADAIFDPADVEKVRESFARMNVPCMAISSVSGQGIEALIDKLSEMIRANS